MNGGDQGPRRGRLSREDAAPARIAAESARGAIEALSAPPYARDPLASRGRYDHRYDARGLVDVPSSTRTHRVAVALGEASAKPRFRTVPREAPEVYREAEITNPFDAPLLAGPVEVFVDGTLLTTTQLTHVDRGGTLYLGLGVEDRVRVARNARVNEGSAGLLGGSTAIDHVVTVDITSALGHPVVLDVIDRVPVTDDKDVEVTVLHARPAYQVYDQVERGEPVRGGVRWTVEVPAGGRAQVEFGYRVVLPSKSEVVGGNRRE
jgi:uncharacterized protein (TIGR02231 family)